MAYRLADTLAAHGAREPLDIDAALQVGQRSLNCILGVDRPCDCNHLGKPCDSVSLWQGQHFLSSGLSKRDFLHCNPGDVRLQSQAFDVIGNFGFGKDFKATMSLYGEGAQACKCLSEGKDLP